MLAKITSLFGMDNFDKAMLTTMISTVIGCGGATIAGKTIVTNLLKLIPGANLVGGLISGTTAAVLTGALGEAYITVLSKLCKGEISECNMINALKEEFEKRGFEVDYYDETIGRPWNRKQFFADNDLIIYALFSRPFRPKGFIDFHGTRASLLGTAFKEDYAVDKTIFVSFGSPYFGGQYLERAQTYVNAYSMLGCVAKAFVRAACGEIEFEGKSPVKL